MEKVIIIIPTYNEKDNISLIIEKLQNIFKQIPHYDMGILVYDSSSPDGTADVVKKLQAKYDNIYLQTEAEKSGLGNAYIQSMKYAMNQLAADIVFEFDADGSHRPEHLPAMMKAFTNGADVVLGSRYVPGGSIPKDWATHRKFLSVVGNIAARVVLSRKIKDYTTGFRGSRTQWLKEIELDSLKSKSYAYKIELLWRLFLKGAKITESPIAFIDREKGVSKLPKDNAKESLILIFVLRYQQLKKYLKVCTVGGVGMILQLICFNLLRHMIHPVYANLISIELAILSNFILNNRLTFKEQKINRSDGMRKWFKKLGVFNLFSLGGMLLQTIIMFTGTHTIGRGSLEENSYAIVGILLGSIYNYKMYKHFVWSTKKNDA